MREAISRELARGGQVYYVYNRVNSIVEMTNQIAALVPQAQVAFAHGQMKEHELEKIMFDFINGEIDVLVSRRRSLRRGWIFPMSNTMIIHDADNMGLSQLYQLRGRVGRSNRTAYAFLMYRRNKMLKESGREASCMRSGNLRSLAVALRSRCGIWSCAVRAICLEASSMATWRRSAMIFTVSCSTSQ